MFESVVVQGRRAAFNLVSSGKLMPHLASIIPLLLR